MKQKEDIIREEKDKAKEGKRYKITVSKDNRMNYWNSIRN
jgi:hypothetical protein